MVDKSKQAPWPPGASVSRSHGLFGGGVGAQPGTTDHCGAEARAARTTPHAGGRRTCSRNSTLA